MIPFLRTDQATGPLGAIKRASTNQRQFVLLRVRSREGSLRIPASLPHGLSLSTSIRMRADRHGRRNLRLPVAASHRFRPVLRRIALGRYRLRNENAPFEGFMNGGNKVGRHGALGHVTRGASRKCCFNELLVFMNG